MMRAPLLVASTLGSCLLGAASGCERLLSIQDPVAGEGPGRDADTGGGPDGGGGGPYGNLPPRSPLLLSEVVVSPSDAEMIEIVNTSTDTVDMSTYYLSDSASYYRLPAQASVDMTDFIVRFPDGALLGPHGVLTVAIDIPQNFATRYGVSPNFSVADTSMDRIIVNGTPRLTDTGEPVILFQWDKHSDLVRDVDIMIVGNPTAANQLTSKAGMSQDGPDNGSDPSTYAIDSNTIKPQAAAPASNTTAMPPLIVSTQRLLLEDNNEHQGVMGNGQSGDDETSEDTSITWDGTTAHPFGPATPGMVPDALKR
ncbi:MAG TPA: hypothetical protein VHW23_46905 [Kofleriaceae bacterium]|jgi:hypothetical protein|nr:hypothetical protein [Kofleriaceae bacterium]